MTLRLSLIGLAVLLLAGCSQLVITDTITLDDCKTMMEKVAADTVDLGLAECKRAVNEVRDACLSGLTEIRASLPTP